MRSPCEKRNHSDAIPTTWATLICLNTDNFEKHFYLRLKMRQAFAEQLKVTPKPIADIDL
jgi:hypothetical protein